MTIELSWKGIAIIVVITMIVTYLIVVRLPWVGRTVGVAEKAASKDLEFLERFQRPVANRGGGPRKKEERETPGKLQRGSRPAGGFHHDDSTDEDDEYLPRRGGSPAAAPGQGHLKNQRHEGNHEDRRHMAGERGEMDGRGRPTPQAVKQQQQQLPPLPAQRAQNSSQGQNRQQPSVNFKDEGHFGFPSASGSRPAPNSPEEEDSNERLTDENADPFFSPLDD